MPSRPLAIAVLLTCLAAFALRAYRLDAQSLWYDEGLSVHLASLPPGQTVAQSAVTDHPPLHAVILNAWMGLAGSSEFAVRFVSVFFGTLVAALTYALGRRVGGSRAGAIGAGLIAIAPMAVWYGQEARGYSVLVTLVLVAALAFLCLVNGDLRFRVWLIYVLASAAAMYTHYFAAFPIIALNFAFLARVVSVSVWRVPYPSDAPRNTQHAIRSWLAAQLAVIMLFLPWLPNAIAQAASNATYFPGRVTWDTVVLDTWRAFAGGEFPSPPPTGILWLALIFVGLLSSSSLLPFSHKRRGASTMLVLLLVPLVLMSALAWDKPKFAPRYLLPSLPAFVTLAALGVDALLRFRNKLLILVALAPMALIPAVDLFVTAQIYFDPQVARPDTRSVAAYVDAKDEPGDAVLLVGGHQAPVFRYYYRGAAEIIPLPPDLLPAAQSPLDARAVARLADIAAKHPRAWLVLWQDNLADPTGIILSELQSRARRLPVGQNFHQMSLLLFDLRGAQFAAEPQNALNASFSGPIRLVGYNLAATTFVASQDVKIGLYFESSGRIDRNYRIFVHLIGPDGVIVAQDDRIAGADSYPTSLWAIGTRMRNTFNIRLPANIAPGTYRLIAGLYDELGRLAVSSGGDSIDVATITVKP